MVILFGVHVDFWAYIVALRLVVTNVSVHILQSITCFINFLIGYCSYIFAAVYNYTVCNYTISKRTSDEVQ